MDGKGSFQPIDIGRHLARNAGLAGSGDEERTLADMTVDMLEEMRKKIAEPYFTPDSPEREKKLKVAAENIVPFYLKKIEKQLAENGGEYLVKGELTWADIVFTNYADVMCNLLKNDFLTAYPTLKAHSNKMKQLPGLKEWFESQPQLPSDMRVAFM